MRRIPLAVAVVALHLWTFAGVAAAASPVKNGIDVSFSSVNTAICGFPIQITGRVTGTATDFYGGDGTLRRAQVHVTEHLTLSANGVTVVADPIAVNFRTVFRPDGTIVSDYLNGLIAKFTLPDGTKFVSAGRFDFAASSVSFTLTGDVGRSGDVEALCDALS